MAETCPVCQGESFVEVLELAVQVPVLANRLHADLESAMMAPVGETRLVCCERCAHIWNAAFDADLVTYDEGYENSLHFSGVFTTFADELAEQLLDRFGLHGKNLVEIGSGKGDFLRLLCRLGDNSGVGYDPSYSPSQTQPGEAEDRLTFVPALFPAEGTQLDADFVYARHVLEHVAQPREVVASVRRSVGSRPCGFYAEVPDGGYLLEHSAVWDLVYEHPSHFTQSSLTWLLQDAGFGVVRSGTSFGGQFLYAEAETRAPVGERPDSTTQVLERARGFGAEVARAIGSWDRFLAEAAGRGRRVVSWGAGSKGVTFLNLVPSAEAVEAIVDLNPRKHGRRVPVTGHEVVGPQSLSALAPHVVLVMNPLYLGEVQGILRDVGIDADVVAVEATAPVGQTAEGAR